MIDFELDSDFSISELFRQNGVHTFSDAMSFVKNLPYGRNSNREDLTLVLTEAKGTCSSKHALLKYLADENLQPEIKLMLGIFKMNGENTPKVKSILDKYDLKYIPEAHNYLKIQGKIYDCTTQNSSEINFVNDLLEETEIQPADVSDFKIKFHKDFLRNWIADKSICLDEIWKIRESCIKSLSSY